MTTTKFMAAVLVALAIAAPAGAAQRENLQVFRDVQKQKASPDEFEGEGVMKELQAM